MVDSFSNENLNGSTFPSGSGVSQSSEAVTNPSARRRGDLPVGAVSSTDLNFVQANWGSKTDLDWRVRLSLPPNFQTAKKCKSVCCSHVITINNTGQTENKNPAK